MPAVVSHALGLDHEAVGLPWLQTALRTVVILITGIVLVRIADKRFFAKKTAFDILLVFVLGSLLGRAINGSEPLLHTIGSSLLLVLLHRALGAAACRWPCMECWIKGHTNVLVKDGKLDGDRLRAHHLSLDDLQEQLRLRGGLNDLSEVSLASLERSGEISVIKKPPSASSI
jgi:uncharacterized membrane protein YcaP (DUF421 family)